MSQGFESLTLYELCGDDKEIEEFPFRNRIKDIRHNSCTECWKDIRKRSYEKNKTTTLDRNFRIRKRNSKWLENYKSKLKCNRCPENHPATLEFHHKNPNKKEYSIAKMTSGFSINKIIEEIKKCEVLCSNCHRIHHYEEKMPL